jgi:hypothetical protein
MDRLEKAAEKSSVEAVAYANVLMRIEGPTVSVKVHPKQWEEFFKDAQEFRERDLLVMQMVSWAQQNARNDDISYLMPLARMMPSKYRNAMIAAISKHMQVADLDYLLSGLKDNEANPENAYAYWRAVMYVVNDGKGIVTIETFVSHPRAYTSEVLEMTRRFRERSAHADALSKRAIEIIESGT